MKKLIRRWLGLDALHVEVERELGRLEAKYMAHIDDLEDRLRAARQMGAQ